MSQNFDQRILLDLLFRMLDDFSGGAYLKLILFCEEVESWLTGKYHYTIVGGFIFFMHTFLEWGKKLTDYNSQWAH